MHDPVTDPVDFFFVVDDTAESFHQRQDGCFDRLAMPSNLPAKSRPWLIESFALDNCFGGSNILDGNPGELPVTVSRHGFRTGFDQLRLNGRAAAVQHKDFHR
jgi:hypothetical protein